MEMNGEFRIAAPRQRVWEGLNDPEVLKQCIPGCQSLEKVSDTEFNGRVIASVGPVRATFGGKVKLSDLDPPQSYRISGEGSGGVAGFAKGGAKVNLAEDGAATLLTYAVQARHPQRSRPKARSHRRRPPRSQRELRSIPRRPHPRRDRGVSGSRRLFGSPDWP